MIPHDSTWFNRVGQLQKWNQAQVAPPAKRYTLKLPEAAALEEALRKLNKEPHYLRWKAQMNKSWTKAEQKLKECKDV